MEKRILIARIISTDVRSRSRAQIIRSELNKEVLNLLDFSGVTFISRSFADELCSIIKEFPECNIKIVEMMGVVKAMYETVQFSRTQKRLREDNKSEIKDIEDINSLSSYFLAF
jgi:hypothetical protein